MKRTAFCDTISVSTLSVPYRMTPEQKMALLKLNTEESFLLLDARFRIITFSPSFQKHWINFGKNISENDLILIKVPADRLASLKSILLKALSGNEVNEEIELDLPDQSNRKYFTRYKPAYDEHKEIMGIYISLTDITVSTTLKAEKSEEEYQALIEQLIASNAELERFAYVTSHDLQEPLRMVSSFLQLLEKKYKSGLDETAQQYIAYAVDGAERMKRLILDLLEYSRVGTNKEDPVDTDMNAVMNEVLENLAGKVRETSAILKVQNLPLIKAGKMQMIQLMQNLVSNSLKYSVSVPEIEIGCEDKGDAWQFFVKDNGIGIEEKFFDKVFIIFQRLHNRNQFSGTGIGLAICKKIIEKHGGAIWIKSDIGKGTTFFFTIKK